MRPIAEIDVHVLLATAISAKRRPAELVEIVAAADLLLGVVPFADKLGQAIERLSRLGLIDMVDGGFRLTPAGQAMMVGQPKKADTETRLSVLKGHLGGYAPQAEYPPIRLSDEVLNAAIQTHKAQKKAPGKNLLMPKPKADRHFKVDGRWRRSPGTRGRTT